MRRQHCGLSSVELPSPERPRTTEDARAAAQAYIRKVVGSAKPSERDEAACRWAVEQVAEITTVLLEQLAPPAHPSAADPTCPSRRLRVAPAGRSAS